MSRIATRPLNSAAVQAADDEFYANHPEFVRPDGTRIPLDPNDPSQADLRSEWMDSYIANGGEVEGGDDDTDRPIDDPTEPCPGEEPETEPTIEVRWSKPSVVPNHNATHPPNNPPSGTPADVPEDAKVSPLVTTTEVPDGTTARVEIRHCETQAMVPGGLLTGLEVRGNQVVDPATGAPPVWYFEAQHHPWDPWDKPYFYFVAYVDYQGLSDQTPDDYVGREPECLRVIYWHVCVSEDSSTGPFPNIPGVNTERTNVAGLLNGMNHSRADSNPAYTNHSLVTQPVYGSHLRNTYVVHHASHGDVVRRGTTNSALATYSDPPDDIPDPANWRGAVCITPSFFGDAEVSNATNIPSVPRYLYYASCCLVGWDSSFGDAMRGRGCQHVIAFRKTIGDSEAVSTAQAFYTAWINDHRLDPAKIPDVFFQVFPSHWSTMQPVLFGPRGGRADGSGGGLSAGEIALIAIAAVAVGVAVGVGLWALLKD